MWTPSSWRANDTNQLPVYKDKGALEAICDQLRTLPPLVHHKECDKLQDLLADAAAGRSFVLWGGDCAEEFRDCNAQSIETKLKVLLQMSLIIIFEVRLPVVRIGRIAGQYGKPRTAPTETLPDGTVVATYKGDMVNGVAVNDREPNPARLLEGLVCFRFSTVYFAHIILSQDTIALLLQSTTCEHFAMEGLLHFMLPNLGTWIKC
jgi:3-deoxy-7-phosphoheptulonate synthase